MTHKIAVLGAGSWGTALAIALARNDHEVYLWGHRPSGVENLIHDGENKRYLPGHTFPVNLTPVSDLTKATTGAHVLVVVPSFAFRETLLALKPLKNNIKGGICWATKGFDPENAELLSVVAADILGENPSLSVVSGPTFAQEVASGLPTAMTVASTGNDSFWLDAFQGESMRVYSNNDIVGVQVGGAAKNVIAVATGISDGLGFGANARAAIITRGLAEISRLGLAFNADQKVFMGLAGLGDLVLTCTDDQSRNRRFGLGLGSGKSIEKIKQEVGQEIEGIHAASLIEQLALSMNIEMPITREVSAVIRGDTSPHSAAKSLLARNTTHE
ncbi:MAG: NAD(P)-dependent glycerol-3-phosphate dehydrogenase [Proteobacteria bacterium]|jgi:glycerol-3-phosphate dehydrogenase (NAD(P)+)|nr:NAD(P)-dependent glycerol-3-phosphate dehydrogenase [Pseudomonadota bacterium]